MKLKVTVAIPVHNGKKFLEAAFTSIISQDVQVSEILILENSSSDNTLSVALDLQIRYADWNVRVIPTDKLIPYANNWNRAFKIAKQAYLLILHHDDILISSTIQKQYNYLTKHENVALVGGQEDKINEKGQLIQTANKVSDKLYRQGEIYEFIKEEQSYIPCSSVMFNMDIIRVVGFFQENILATDELYWPKVLSSYPIAILGTALINRREHNNQTEFIDFKEKKKML